MGSYPPSLNIIISVTAFYTLVCKVKTFFLFLQMIIMLVEKSKQGHYVFSSLTKVQQFCCFFLPCRYDHVSVRCRPDIHVFALAVVGCISVWMVTGSSSGRVRLYCGRTIDVMWLVSFLQHCLVSAFCGSVQGYNVLPLLGQNTLKNSCWIQKNIFVIIA